MTSLGSARALKDLDHGAGAWETGGSAAGISGFQICFRKLKRKQRAPLRWRDSALLPRTGCPGPAPRPIESGPVGGAPDRGISLMMPTCSQAGSCHPGASMSLAAALGTSAPYSADALCTYVGGMVLGGDGGSPWWKKIKKTIFYQNKSCSANPR